MRPLFCTFSANWDNYLFIKVNVQKQYILFCLWKLKYNEIWIILIELCRINSENSVFTS